MAKKALSIAAIKRFFWHALLVMALLGVFAASGLLWNAGRDDAQSSVKDGRRIAIRLDNGAIEGFQAKEQADEPETKDKAEDAKKGGEVELHNVPEADKAAEAKKDAPKDSKPDSKEKPVEKAAEKAADKAQDKKEASPEAKAYAEKPAVAEEPKKPEPAKEEPKKENPKKEEVTPKEETKEEPKKEEPKAEPTKEEPVKEEPQKEEPKADNAAEQQQSIKAIAGSLVPSVSAVRGVNASLTEKSKDGLLPKVADDGTKPWKYYAKPAEYKGDYPVIAIIVIGLGTSKAQTEAAIKLPENITLSFSPYARNAESWATAARVTGHEVMLDLPLQPADYPASDPGPYGLLADAKPEANEQKLQWLLSRFGAFTGVVTPLSDGFVNQPLAFQKLLESVGKRGLITVVARDLAGNQSKAIVDESKDPVLVGDVLIDEDLSDGAIKSRIATLQQRAKERGFAVGIAQSYPITMTHLAALPEVLSKEGFSLMPASYIARKRFK